MTSSPVPTLNPVSSSVDQPSSLVHSPTTKLCHFGTKGLGTRDVDDLLYEDFGMTPVVIIQFLLELSILVLVLRKHLPGLISMEPLKMGRFYCW